MNPDTAHLPKKTRIKRWLPFFIIAAIAINIHIVPITIDMIRIFLASIGLSVRIEPVFTAETIRTYGNIALIIVFLVVALKGLQERK